MNDPVAHCIKLAVHRHAFLLRRIQPRQKCFRSLAIVSCVYLLPADDLLSVQQCESCFFTDVFNGATNQFALFIERVSFRSRRNHIKLERVAAGIEH